MQPWQRYAAEAYGTFVLVGIGTGAVLATAAVGGDAVVTVAVALAFGLALVAGLYTVGHISGGHFNPAVSLGAFIDRRIDLESLIAYWAAQLVGGVVASLALAWIISREAVEGTVTTVGKQFGVAAWGAFVGEAILTAIFMYVFLVVTTRKDDQTRYLAIGFTYAAIHLIGIPFTGASVNPARSFAPALVSGEFADFWVYIAGPLLGAVVGWVLYKVIEGGDLDFASDVAEIRDSMS